MDLLKIGTRILFAFQSGERAIVLRPGVIVRAWPDEFIGNPSHPHGYNLCVFTDFSNDISDVGADSEKGVVWRTSIQLNTGVDPVGGQFQIAE